MKNKKKLVPNKDYIDLGHINELMSYDECLKVLKVKYGVPQYPYFCNESCRSAQPKNRTTGTKQNYCHLHHDKENIEGDLAKKNRAINFPGEGQQPQFLTYCDVFEHILLHILILKEQKRLIGGGIRTMGVNLMEFYIPNHQFKRESSYEKRSGLRTHYPLEFVLKIKPLIEKRIVELCDLWMKDVQYESVLYHYVFMDKYFGKKQMTINEIKPLNKDEDGDGILNHMDSKDVPYIEHLLNQQEQKQGEKDEK